MQQRLWPRAVWLSDSYSEVSAWVRSGRRGLGCNLDIFLNICAWGHSNGSPLMGKHTHTQTKRQAASELEDEELPALIGNASAYYDDVKPALPSPHKHTHTLPPLHPGLVGPGPISSRGMWFLC